MKFHDRLKRVARKNKSVITDDPEGVLGTLQITRRLLYERSSVSLHEALTLAARMSVPKNEYRAWWKAASVIFKHTPSVMPKDRADLIKVLDESIRDQGSTNIFARKGPRA